MSAHNVFLDSRLSDRERLERLYEGDVFVYSPSRATSELCVHAREMIVSAFEGLNPGRAQAELSARDFVATANTLTTSFIHDPRSKARIAAILAEFSCNAGLTYVDVPRLGIARHGNDPEWDLACARQSLGDTRLAVPNMQITWWIAIYDFNARSSIALHPLQHTNEMSDDASRLAGYDAGNRNGRHNGAKHTTAEALRLVPRAGTAILFSGVHMRSTVSNTSDVTAWSADFRTVNIEDVRSGHRSRNVGGRPRGKSLRDFMRARDLELTAEDIALAYGGAAEIVGGSAVSPFPGTSSAR